MQLDVEKMAELVASAISRAVAPLLQRLKALEERPLPQNGKDGAPGAAGPQGLPGETGAAGLQGERGMQGELGQRGADGAPGPEGLQGAAGPQGEAGPAGPPGPAGQPGPQGAPGPAGVAPEQLAAMAERCASLERTVERLELRAAAEEEELSAEACAASMSEWLQRELDAVVAPPAVRMKRSIIYNDQNRPVQVIEEPLEPEA